MAEKNTETEAVIGRQAEVNGTLKDKESVCIEGKFEGKIQVGGSVIVGKEAFIKADIQARSITIGGKVVGNVECQEELKLLPKASLQGNVKASGLVIPAGASFNGECRMISSGETVSSVD